jgi:threonine/homoserine/homoserine lactone efflux protein
VTTSGHDPARLHGNLLIPSGGLWTTSRRRCQLCRKLLNPKIGIFYTAVLPQFIPVHTSHLAMGVLLALVHDIEGIAWFTALILGAERLGALLRRLRLRRRTVQRWVDAVTGSVLVAFGLTLALSER